MPSAEFWETEMRLYSDSPSARQVALDVLARRMAGTQRGRAAEVVAVVLRPSRMDPLRPTDRLYAQWRVVDGETRSAEDLCAEAEVLLDA